MGAGVILTPFWLREYAATVVEERVVGFHLAVVESMARYRAERQSHFRIAQIALALRAYETENGKFPRELRDLVPAYLSEVPQDAFGDGLFTYRVDDDGLEDDGVLVYGVGMNGRDDNGIGWLGLDGWRENQACDDIGVKLLPLPK